MKKVGSLALAVLMLVSLTLTGCQKKEAPVAADQVAVTVFDLILKNDASSAVALFGYSSEEEARADFGLDDNLYDQMADELISQLSGMGYTVTTEDMQAFINAFISMFKDVELTAVVKEMDEKAGTAVVTCTISTFDRGAMTEAMTNAMTEALSDPSVLASGDMEAAFGQILKAISGAIADLTPTEETADFDVDFELGSLDINGKKREAWLPADADAFATAISTNALGGSGL